MINKQRVRMARGKKLVIMESPTKTKTIKQYLGKQYEVLSTAGHIVELSKSKGTLRLGFDVDSFVAFYRIIKGKKPLIANLQKAVRQASEVFLATDPDREGEAIAYHLQQQLGLKSTTKRVLFDDLSKTTVLAAFAAPGQLNLKKVAAQETRRILDRIIGFRLSYLLSKKTSAKSAGRVQSVALNLIAQNAALRADFVRQEYWTLTVEHQQQVFEYVSHKARETVTWKDLQQVLQTCEKKFVVASKKTVTVRTKPPLPFSTSTFLQAAGNQLHLSPARAMMLLQQLYEGVKWDQGLKALITYPRTDAKRMSRSFVQLAQQYIANQYGDEYVATNVNFQPKKSGDVKIQDAHEAIRILDPTVDLQVAQKRLTPALFKVYQLLYQRTLGALMTPNVTARTTYQLKNANHLFKTTVSREMFAGYKLLLAQKTSKTKLVDWELEAVLTIEEALAEQHFTQPVSLYSEASLIKTLEEFGIGRPSTYATILNILVKRGYVTKQNRQFTITNRGIATNQLLQQWFHSFINVNYTAKIEHQLDDIAYGKNNLSKERVLNDCWEKINGLIETAFEAIPDKEIKYYGTDCPQCQRPLVYRESRYGLFIGCSGFPKCRYVQNLLDNDYGECPQCHQGKLQLKADSRGRKFYGCSLFKTTKCNFIGPYQAPKAAKSADTAPKLLKRRCQLPYRLLEEFCGR